MGPPTHGWNLKMGDRRFLAPGGEQLELPTLTGILSGDLFSQHDEVPAEWGGAAKTSRIVFSGKLERNTDFWSLPANSGG